MTKWLRILTLALFILSTTFLTQAQTPIQRKITGITFEFTSDEKSNDRDVPEAVSLSLNKTVGLDTNACSTSDSISVAPGTQVTYCYKATNTGSESLILHTLVDDKLGQILTNVSYPLAPSASAFVTATAVINQPVLNTATWTAESSNGRPASDSDSASVDLLEPKLSLNKTVGTDPNSCSSKDSITVDPGTEVTYCYNVTNTGDLDLVLHTLEDDQLGSIFSKFSYTLAPAASAFVTATAVINASVTNTATWTGYTSGDIPVSDKDTATVNLSFGKLYLPIIQKP